MEQYQKVGLVENTNGLRDGIEMTFETLHKAIVERDLSTLSTICEQNLRYAFIELFEQLDQEQCIIVDSTENESQKTEDYDSDVENATHKQGGIDLEIIDWQMILGTPSISREECRLNGLYDFSYGFLPNSTCVIPDMSSMISMQEMKLNLQFTIKVKSNLSLQIVDLKSLDKFPKQKVT